MDLLDAPITPKELGTTVTTMRQKCDISKKEREAVSFYLPCRPGLRGKSPLLAGVL